MKTVWLVLVISDSVLDALILLERVVMGGGKRELMHGAGGLLFPAYGLLMLSWCWVLWVVTIMIRDRALGDVKSAVILGVVAIAPLFL
jgi:hypothetical protein